MIDFSFLIGWIKYPLAELVHVLQGALAGWLGCRAIIKKEPSDAICALIVTLGFAIYEVTEKWQIGDDASSDIENFWVICVLTGLVYGGIQVWRTKRGSH